MDTFGNHSSHDVEKNPGETTQTLFIEPEKLSGWTQIARLGVELRGVQPVTLEERHDKHPINLLSFWSTVGITLLA